MFWVWFILWTWCWTKYYVFKCHTHLHKITHMEIRNNSVLSVYYSLLLLRRTLLTILLSVLLAASLETKYVLGTPILTTMTVFIPFCITWKIPDCDWVRGNLKSQVVYHVQLKIPRCHIQSFNKKLFGTKI